MGRGPGGTDAPCLGGGGAEGMAVLNSLDWLSPPSDPAHLRSNQRESQ